MESSCFLHWTRVLLELPLVSIVLRSMEVQVICNPLPMSPHWKTAIWNYIRDHNKSTTDRNLRLEAIPLMAARQGSQARASSIRIPHRDRDTQLGLLLPHEAPWNHCFFSFWNMTYLKLNPNKCWISLSIHTLDPWVHVQYFLHFHAFLVLTVNSWASQFLPTPPRIAGSTLVNFVDFRDKVRDRSTMFLYWQIGFHPFFKQGCQNDPVENQMMKPNFESHKQNQTNTWWQSAGLLFRPQIGFALLTIEFCWFHHQRTLYKDEGLAGVTSWLDFFEMKLYLL